MRIAGLVFAMLFPTVVTLIYFRWLQGSESWIQQAAYSILKIIQFGFPAAWVFWDRGFLKPWQERTGKRSRPSRAWAAGILFGLLVGVLLFALYYGWLQGTPAAEQLVERAREKLNDLGLTSPWKFAAVGIFYALIHSGLEEYYWRWFVFRGLRNDVGFGVASVVSSLAFMTHHVVLLTFYFGWDSWLAYACSFAVAVGGWAWAALYEWSGRLGPPWVSHLIVDAALFGLGYLLMFGSG